MHVVSVVVLGLTALVVAGAASFAPAACVTGMKRSTARLRSCGRTVLIGVHPAGTDRVRVAVRLHVGFRGSAVRVVGAAFVLVAVAVPSVRASPAPATGCVRSATVSVTGPKSLRSVAVRVGHRRAVAVRPGTTRRLRHGARPGTTFTVRLTGRSVRTGRRVTRVRRVRVCSAQPATPAPMPTPVTGSISPDNPRLRYEGRWAVGPGRATTVNSGARVLLRFRGASVAARFKPTATPPQVYAYVDGVKSRPIVVDRDRLVLTPPGLGSGVHTLDLTVKDVAENAERWTPPFGAAMQLDGFELGAGTELLTPPDEPDRHLTFLGDSITQGVSISCFIPGSDCADSTLDYARLLADRFGAAVEQVGFGSQGLTKAGGGGVPRAGETIDLAHAGAAAPSFDADVVVVNQATNDIVSAASEQRIRVAYGEYLRQVRRRYPTALVVAMQPLGLGGIITTDAVQAAVADVADPRTIYVSTRGWLLPTDYSEQIHPNAGGHRKVADLLGAEISRRTGWTPGAG